MPSSTVISLVACTKSKAPSPQPARLLYTSPLFRSTAAYAELVANRWFILSARHGLLHPDQTVAPYEQTLHRMSAVERRAWSLEVFSSIQQVATTPARIIFLAGTTYRQYLGALLEHAGFSVSVPMAGLRLGEQLRWLKEQAQVSRSMR